MTGTAVLMRPGAIGSGGVPMLLGFQQLSVVETPLLTAGKPERTCSVCSQRYDQSCSNCYQNYCHCAHIEKHHKDGKCVIPR